MRKSQGFLYRIALTVALGGFLMGFDASVISGVNKFITIEFDLTEFELGWAVSSLTLVATFAMFVAGPISDAIGRRTVLKYAAILFAISAIGSALAPNFLFLVIARMIGGIGVGVSLILAPMYIAEVAPAEKRGQLVSFNQLNIVLGISVAFFTNFLILKWGQSDTEWAKSLGLGVHNWRWMLGLEALPAILYFFGLLFVPRSPRWLILKGHLDEAKSTLERISTEDPEIQVAEVQAGIEDDAKKTKVPVGEVFKPAMRLVLTIAVVVAVLQQITGINAVFFYAPMIFEQSGIGTDASFALAIYVGVINLVFTVIAILFIDRFGRKPLLSTGVAGIAIAMFLLAYGFGSASYKLTDDSVAGLPEELDRNKISLLVNTTFENDVAFKEAVYNSLGEDDAKLYESDLLKAAITMNPTLILVGILGFVASFAFSIGPIMWVLFSELFPLKVKGIAISLAGTVNSAVSFLVQLIFPWELSVFGSSLTFLIYGVFAAAGFFFVVWVIPETKGKSLEELEKILIK